MWNKTSRKFPAHESGSGGSVAYFLAKADFFLTNADLQEGALGHALLCIQCLISRDLGAKQWPATKHWLQGQIMGGHGFDQALAGERWRRWWRWLSSFFDLCFLNFFLLVFLILHWWQGLMIYDKQDHGPGGERWRRLEARQVSLFCVDLTPSRWLSPYYIDCKVR